jgi:hypothetical protein
MKPARIILIFVVIFVLAITAVGVISEIVAGTHGFAVPVPPEAIKYFQQLTKKQGDLSAGVFGETDRAT